MIVSVYMKTESSDVYLFQIEDVSSSEDFAEKCYQLLEDELAYVFDYEVTSNSDKDVEFEKALRSKINSLQEEY